MKQNIFLMTILIIGIFLRFYQLGALPDSYSPDELAQGYTAYSILNTGKDEWGSQNPFSLRSFGDYKLPLQTWLIIPSVKIFSLTPFAVRFPNALLSVVAFVSLYYLVKKIFPDKLSLPLISTLIFALSPWALPMSRLALEANLIVSLFIIALTLFYYQKIFLSAVFFASCFYTYHSAKVFLPLFLSVLIFFNYRRQLVKFIFYLIIFILPIFILNQSISSRSSDIAIFNPTDKWSTVADIRYTLSQNGLPDIFSRSIQNKLSYTLRLFSQNYLSYFSPQFFITQGAGETTYGMIPGFGVLGLTVTLGLFITIWLLLTHKLKINSPIIILLLGLIISPLAAALAKGNYAANRASFMLPFLIILSAIGINHLKIFFRFIFIFILLIESLFFILSYFYSANQVLAEGMLYGHQQVNQYIQQLRPSRIIYSRKLSEPQAYYLFFQKPNPDSVQNQTSSWLEYDHKQLSFLDQLGEYRLDNVIFKEISLPSDITTSDTLIIGRPDEFLDLKPTSIIFYPYYSQRKPAIYLYLSP